MAKRKPTLTRAEKLLRADGSLCVTFVNTEQRQALESYDHLLAWAIESNALDPADARRLAATVVKVPGLAAGAVRRARTLGARLERVLLALAAGDPPAAADLKAFNRYLRQAMAASESQRQNVDLG